MANEMAQDKEGVIFSRQGQVGIITLNRSEAMNSLTGALCKRLSGILEEVERNEEIRTVIITGVGEEAFCAGIDLKERKGMSDADVNAMRKYAIFPVFRLLETLTKPLIGAINGLALGGGAEIALICDIRIASQSARFGQTEVKWGIIPAAGACQRLPAIVGVGLAKEILLTGRIISAEEGYQIGLYNKVTTVQDLMGQAMETAQLIAANAPVAVRQIKKGINLGVENQLAMAFDREASEICYHTEDRLEGIAAFSEKRKPKYRGV